MKVRTIQFDEGVYSELTTAASERGVSINWMVNKLCEEGLEPARAGHPGDDVIAEEKIAYLLPTCPHCGGNLADPDVDKNRLCLSCRYAVMAATYTHRVEQRMKIVGVDPGTRGARPVP